MVLIRHVGQRWNFFRRVIRQYAWVWGLMVSCVLAEGLDLTEEVMRFAEQRYGTDARERLEALRALISDYRDSDPEDKLIVVNDFFNRVPYDTDWGLWNREDYWATPIEMLGIHGADCEDYSIAKYFTLREMGMAPEKLRITYVKALELNEAHMVLAYYEEPASEPLILDNLTDRIRPASVRTDLAPVYSFNGESLWLAVTRSQGQKVGTSDRISLWNDLRDKLAKELEQ